mgnify:CR=1 FL=1
MKNPNIHHIINIKAGTHESVEYDHPMTSGFTPQDWIKPAHEMVADPMFFFAFEYEEAMVFGRRDMPREDYEAMMSNERRQIWLQYKDCPEQGYEPDLNPGGGSYHM